MAACYREWKEGKEDEWRDRGYPSPHTNTYRTSTSLNSPNPIMRQSIVSQKEFSVFSSKNIIGHTGQAVLIPEGFAQGKEKGRLTTSHWASNTHGKGSLRPIAHRKVRHLSGRVPPWMIEDLVGVAMIRCSLVSVGVGMGRGGRGRGGPRGTFKAASGVIGISGHDGVGRRGELRVGKEEEEEKDREECASSDFKLPTRPFILESARPSRNLRWGTLC